MSSDGHKEGQRRGSYPPSSASLAFPEDPFAQSTRKSGSQLVHQNGPESLSDWAKSTRFTVLNHFSHVTNVARNGAHTLLSSPLFQAPASSSDAGGGSGGGGQRFSGASSLATSLLQHGPVGPFGPNDPNWRHSELAKKSGTGDFDSAHVYLARWAKIVAEEGEASRRREAEARRASHRATMAVEESELGGGGFEVWDRLPHIERPDATRMRDNPLSAQAWRSMFDEDGRPTASFAQMKSLVFRQGFGKGKQKAVSGTHWDQLGPRAECWSFLLGAQDWDMTERQAERRQRWNVKAEEYWAIKTKHFHKIVQTEELTHDSEKEEMAFWKEQRHRIHVDCMRVDRKLPFFSDTDVLVVVDGDDPQGRPVNAHAQRLEEILLSFVEWDGALDDVKESTTDDNTTHRQSLGGYVQGMSDLCAPLYAVCNGDEAKTFWLLVGLMRRARRNFYTDQSGMKTQLSNLQNLVSIMDAGLHAHLDKTDSLNLFFCFRWLLVYFKREFAYDDILLLWEAIWAAEPDQVDGNTPTTTTTTTTHDEEALSRHFEVFIALAMLEQQRDVVVKYLHHFDEILQYMNGLAGQFDVDSLLAEAQTYCLMLRTLVVQQRNGDASGKQTMDQSLSQITLNDELRDLVAVK